MGRTFSTILNEFWTDFLQFSAKDGGGGGCAPLNIALRSWQILYIFVLRAEK